MMVPFEGGEVNATISIGVAEVGECPNGTQAELLALADRRLYMAKTLGRNRIVCTE
jgi:PleD family two-component response regulator